MEPILQIEGLKKSYGAGAARTEALKGVHLTLEAGEFTGIMARRAAARPPCSTACPPSTAPPRDASPWKAGTSPP